MRITTNKYKCADETKRYYFNEVKAGQWPHTLVRAYTEPEYKRYD
jgi:hypothetical protein